MAKTYIISDLHIGHSSIHKKWRTQFASQEAHDEYMCEAWNSVVFKRDTVKVLGDFIMGRENLHYLNKLNGTIHWLLGNHDVKITKDVLNDYPRVSCILGVQAYKGAVLSHVPVHPGELSPNYRSWSFNIHGHVHKPSNNPEVSADKRYYNVNADVMGYAPREFHSIMQEVGLE